MNCIYSLSALVNEMIDINKDISGKQNFKLKTMNKKNDVLFMEQRKVLKSLNKLKYTYLLVDVLKGLGVAANLDNIDLL